MNKFILTTALGMVAIAGSAAAQQAAPDYYIEALFTVSTAEQVASFCPEVGLDIDHANMAAESVIVRLSAEGISGDQITTLTGVETAIADLQAAFVARHDLEDPNEAKLCAAARSEMGAGTAIGAYFVEAAQ